MDYSRVDRQMAVATIVGLLDEFSDSFLIALAERLELRVETYRPEECTLRFVPSETAPQRKARSRNGARARR